MRSEPPSPGLLPLAATLAAVALDDAVDTEEIFELLLRAAGSIASFAAVLSVHHDELRGWRAIADEDRLERDAISTLRIARSAVPAFATALATRMPSVGSIATGEPFVDGLLETLGGSSPAVVVLPVVVGARPVALVVAYRTDAALAIGDIVELVALVGASNPALARVLRARSKAAAPRVDTRADSGGYEVEVSLGGLEARRAALATQRRAEAWPELVETIRELIRDGVESGEPGEDEQLELLLELGRVELDHLGRADRAIEAWRSAQTIDAADRRVLDALEGLFARQGRWLECVELLEQRAALTDEPAERSAVLLNLAAIARERLDDDARAIEAYERILAWDPSQEVASRQLEGLLRAGERWPELAVAVARRAVAERDLGRRSELHAELAEIYETRLDRPGEAIAAYERALAGEPESMPVLVALHRLYLTDEAWPALDAILPRLIDALAAAAPVEVLVDLHVELGTVRADHLGRPDDAVRAFQDALALDPGNAAAFQELTRVYEATGQVEALLDATELAIDAIDGRDATARAEQQRRYRDLAAAWQEHARLDRAIGCWQKLLARAPRDGVAHQGLARALRDDGQWPALATALRTHAAQVGEPAERIAVLRELADVLETQLDDAVAATAVNDEIATLDPSEPAALDALARLHDRAGRLQPALEALAGLLEQATEPRRRADLLQRIGQVHLSARDAASARHSLARAIALDPTNAAAHEGMARVHLQQGELVAAGDELLHAARLGTSRQDTIRCLADAAWLYRHRLGDATRARDCLHRILELEPAHADAKQALAELLDEAQEWESLWPHLEAQVARARAGHGPEEPDECRELYTKAARCAVELGKFPIALELYELACSIAPSTALLVERAEALYRSRALEAAAAAYQTIALHHATLGRAELLAVYRRLAQIHTELGKLAQALAFHRKVLDVDGAHRETHEDLVELHLAGGRFDEAVASLRALAAGASEIAERTTLLERIGDLYRHQLSSAPRAASTYLDALELDAGNHRVLQKLLDLQSDEGQWSAAVDTIGRFLDHETDRARRAAYFLAAAAIRRTELVDLPGALECYERALDELLAETPLGAATRQRAIATFQIIDTLGTAERDWKYLDQAYRRMIKRMPKDDPILIVLWHALGELYRRRLELPQSAIQAYEVAHALDADKSPERARILAELYARVGVRESPQIAEAAVEPAAKPVADPTDADAYHALGRASLEAGRVDEAWCAARALVVLKRATFDEEVLYRKYQASEVRKATGILDEDSWALVRRADEDLVISSIFALIADSIVALRAGSPRSFELGPKERMPVETDARVVAKIFRHGARVLNIPLPDVYAQPRRPGRLLLANCLERGRVAPVVIVGRDLMTGYRDTEIAAAVGGMLALLRPGYYLKLTLSTVEELEAALAAAAQLVGKRVGRPELAPLTSVFAPQIQKHLTRPLAEVLLALVERLPDKPDLVRWRNCVDAAAQRAGLLVAGELGATVRMISSEATALGGARPSQRVQELVAYSVSSSYFAVRRHLGVGVA